MLKQKIEDDLKAAMLSGDKQLVSTLRTIKSTILYAEVGKGPGNQEISDQEVIEVLKKEAKKRQESATIYERAGEKERAEAELAEKAAIEKYLPEPVSQEEIQKIIDVVCSEIGELSAQKMGQIIAAVKERTKGSADGAQIAILVKQKLGV